MTERTMRSVSQRNPADTENVFGAVFRRGPTVAADGGAPEAVSAAEGEDAADADEAEAEADESMKHVDQTAPGETEPNRVWERGKTAEGDAEDE